MQGRRSVHAFSDQSVPRKLIEQAIQTAGAAPSGAHREPWHFVAINDPGIKLEIRNAAEKEERAGYEWRMSSQWFVMHSIRWARIGTNPFLKRLHGL